MKKFLARVLFTLAAYTFAVSGPAYANSPASDPSAECAGTASAGVGSVQLQSLSSFIAALRLTNANEAIGVYVPSVFALQVVQQPSDAPTFVSILPNTLTQFGLAAQQGTIGLLAHNFLAGALFYNLAAGQQVDLVVGDGSVRAYRVSEIRHFRALSPYDLYSAFVDMDRENGQISSTELFNQMYGSGNRVVFMTCITTNGSSAGGRLFVIATPM